VVAPEPRTQFPLKAAFLAAGITALVAVTVIWSLNRDDGRSVSTASAIASALASHPEAAWGPLAVQGPPERNMDAALHGRLSITDACVLLIAPPDDKILLVWPADRTSWDDELRRVAFVNQDGTAITLRNGMSLRLGGGGFSEDESDIATADWLDQLTLVNPPEPACIPSEGWIVADVIEAE